MLSNQKLWKTTILDKLNTSEMYNFILMYLKNMRCMNEGKVVAYEKKKENLSMTVK